MGGGASPPNTDTNRQEFYCQCPVGSSLFEEPLMKPLPAASLQPPCSH